MVDEEWYCVGMYLITKMKFCGNPKICNAPTLALPPLVPVDTKHRKRRKLTSCLTRDDTPPQMNVVPEQYKEKQSPPKQSYK